MQSLQLKVEAPLQIHLGKTVQNLLSKRNLSLRWKHLQRRLVQLEKALQEPELLQNQTPPAIHLLTVIKQPLSCKDRNLRR